MTKRTRVGGCGLVLLGAGAWALAQVGGQQPPQGGDAGMMQQPMVTVAPPPPSTRIEGMIAARGTVILKGYTEVGEIDGEQGSGLRVVAIEVTDVAAGEKAYGLAVAVRQASSNNDGQAVPAAEAVVYVDADEIDALAKAIDFLGRMQPNAGGAMHAYEAHYKSKAELEVTNFDTNGARMAAVRGFQVSPTTGQVTGAVAYFTVQRLADVRNQIAAGKDVVDRARGAAGK